MQEMPVWEGSGGLPHKLVKHWYGSCADGFEQCEFGMESILTEGKAIAALYHRGKGDEYFAWKTWRLCPWHIEWCGGS